MTPTQVSHFRRTKVGLFQHLCDDRLAGLVQGARVVGCEPHEAVIEFGEALVIDDAVLDQIEALNPRAPLQSLQCMGIHLDDQRNRDARGFDEICRISTDDSPVTVLVVPTDVNPPIRDSGDLHGTPGCTLEGPAGRVTLDQRAICALRRIQMTPADALRFGGQLDRSPTKPGPICGPCRKSRLATAASSSRPGLHPSRLAHVPSSAIQVRFW